MLGWILFGVMVVWKLIFIYNISLNSHPSFLSIRWNESLFPTISIIGYRKTGEDILAG